MSLELLKRYVTNIEIRHVPRHMYHNLSRQIIGKHLNSHILRRSDAVSMEFAWSVGHR